MGFRQNSFAVLLFTAAVASSLFAGAPVGNKETGVAVVQANNRDESRIEGEKRFRANCGRCHAPPRSFLHA